MAMKTVTVLKRAKKLIETKGWARGEAARDKNGNGCDAMARTAASFCAVGALDRVCSGDWEPYMAARNALVTAMPKSARDARVSLPGYNDAPRRTKAQVLALFDRAIAKLEAA